jgi:site-specific DNA-methyltransferase (adenine-specific)
MNHLLPSFTKTKRTDNAGLINQVFNLDLFELCQAVGDASVDMILCDLPYGTTACSWDSVIPFEPMWQAFRRVIKPRGAIVLTAAQPFTSALVMSQPKMFRHEWIWHKTMATSFLNANRQPLQAHESVLVFCDSGTNYTPQMTEGEPYSTRPHVNVSPRGTIRDKTIRDLGIINSGTRHPRSVITFENQTGLHPTQKPVALFEYLIKTYTREGDIVFDPCAGSGTTAIAAMKTNRRFICGDITPEYVALARQRIATCDPYQDTPIDANHKQLSMFAGSAEIVR